MLNFVQAFITLATLWVTAYTTHVMNMKEF